MDDHPNNLFVICFGAEWCIPGVVFRPQYHRLAGEFSNIFFLEIDVDIVPILKSRYNISILPTILMMRNTSVITSTIGDDMEKLRCLISYISKQK
jgi:thioredoxin 1